MTPDCLLNPCRQMCKRDQSSLQKRIGTLLNENRELKGRLMDAERFRELVHRSNAKIRDQTSDISKLRSEIVLGKQDLQRCRIDLMNAKNYKVCKCAFCDDRFFMEISQNAICQLPIKPPGYKKDTHVNLDMQMWITHNQTKEKELPQFKVVYKPPEYKPNYPVIEQYNML